MVALFFLNNQKNRRTETWVFSRQDFDFIEPQSRKITFTTVGSEGSLDFFVVQQSSVV